METPKKRGRPPGSKNKKDKKVDKKLRTEVQKVGENLPSLYNKTLVLISLVEDSVLQGMCMKEIRAILLSKGYDISVQKCYRLMRIARDKIAKRFDKDFEFSYQFCVENLMDIHNRALQDDDQKLRLATIDQYMKLAGLNIQKIQTLELKISKEDLDNYEQMLFG